MNAWRFFGRRRAGVLLHPTSLPGDTGIGEIGPYARTWIERLADAGASLWQFLPLGPTGYGDCPYQTLSSFAANPLLISLHDLVEEHWLQEDEIAHPPGRDSDRVDFGALIPWKRARLRQAVERWRRNAPASERRRWSEFCRRHAGWLIPYARFAVLKDLHDGRPWYEWPRSWATREPGALEQLDREQRDRIEEVTIVQYWFERQWRRVRAQARARGVRLVGDLPIFVALDSADVWANPELFQLDDRGQPTVVAGVPPDYFSATGQRWGNPLYRWEAHEANGFAWWTRRVGRALAWADVVRLDHFRGFAAYWEIPASEPTAVHGRWVRAPGNRLLTALQQAYRHVPFVAEDLGIITEDVIELRRRFRLPGMLVLQFTVERLLQDPPRPPEECAPDTVMYTGTHDNDTTQGWFHTPPRPDLPPHEVERHAAIRRRLLEYLGTDGRAIHWDMIALAWRSNAMWAVAPVQDLIGLGSEARFNTPGTPQGNWQWRLTEPTWRRCDWARFKELTLQYGRARSTRASGP